MNNSITITCDGYNQKLNQVLTTVLDAITNFYQHIEEIQFNVTKEKLKQSLENIKLGSPWSMITYNMKNKWADKFLNYQILLDKIDNITIEHVKSHCINLFKNINVNMVSIGNIIPNDLIDIHKYFDTNYDKSTYQNIEKVNPVYGRLDFKNHNKNEVNEAIGIYYQVFNQKYDFEKAAKLSMLETLIREPFFDQLRTKEQLGYLVNTSSYSFLDSYGLIFLIQSPVKDSNYLADRIKVFQKEFVEKLENYQEFDAQKASLINMIAEPDNRLNQLAFRIIKEISLQTYFFDRKEKLITAISKLQLKDMVKFYQENILENKNYVEIHNMKN